VTSTLHGACGIVHRCLELDDIINNCQWFSSSEIIDAKIYPHACTLYCKRRVFLGPSSHYPTHLGT
jgi:hypothetical protein